MEYFCMRSGVTLILHALFSDFNSVSITSVCDFFFFPTSALKKQHKLFFDSLVEFNLSAVGYEGGNLGKVFKFKLNFIIHEEEKSFVQWCKGIYTKPVQLQKLFKNCIIHRRCILSKPFVLFHFKNTQKLQMDFSDFIYTPVITLLHLHVNVNIMQQ